jgi:hypothetical protein
MKMERNVNSHGVETKIFSDKNLKAKHTELEPQELYET